MADNSFSTLVEALGIQTEWELAQIKGPHISRRTVEQCGSCTPEAIEMFDRYQEIKNG